MGPLPLLPRQMKLNSPKNACLQLLISPFSHRFPEEGSPSLVDQQTSPSESPQFPCSLDRPEAAESGAGVGLDHLCGEKKVEGRS